MAKRAAARSSRPVPDWAWLGLIVALVLIAYVPAIDGGLLWDDDAHITKLALQGLDGLRRIWFELGATAQYYPLLHSAFWLEHQMWGDSVQGYHLTNMLLHAISAWLVILIVRRLSLPGAVLAGLIFAVHPVQVESVAWISEQKNTLSTVFYLASALVYLEFDRTRSRNRYWLGLALFVCALLSKTVTATLPGVLLVILWWQRGKLNLRRDVQPLAPWLVLGVTAGIFSAWVERKFIGAEGSQFALSFLDRCLLAGRVIWFYLWKAVWPANLTFIYPHWTIDAGVWWQWLFPIAAIAVLAVFAVMARRGRRSPLAAALFFTGTLVPVLGFLNVYPFQFSYVADHFQYVAILGVIVPAAILAQWKPRIAGTALVTVLLVLSWSQSGMYRQAEPLYRETLARNPDSWLANNNLAGVLMRTPGRALEAVPYLQAALRLKPDIAEAHNNLGLILSETPGKRDEAIAEYQAALRIKPAYAEAHNNLGSALAEIPDRHAEAIAEYQTAIKLAPDYPEAHNNLGSALSELPDRRADAIAEFETALRLNPNLAEAHANLGVALARDPARVAEAMLHLEAALRLRPDMQPVRQLLAQLRTASLSP